jgi:enamine deaminase RidA (YjgF/YER057c/UK114 family)
LRLGFEGGDHGALLRERKERADASVNFRCGLIRSELSPLGKRHREEDCATGPKCNPFGASEIPLGGRESRGDSSAIMNPEETLTSLGLTLPTPPAAAGSYVPTVRTGNLLFCAGTICMVNGQMTHVGQVGKEQSVAAAQKAAEVCALNTLANIKAAVGSLEKIARIVMVNGFVNAIDGFADSPAVINGASDLFVKVFGEAGKHARAAVAVNGLPKGSTTEIQVVVELKS